MRARNSQLQCRPARTGPGQPTARDSRQFVHHDSFFVKPSRLPDRILQQRSASRDIFNTRRTTALELIPAVSDPFACIRGGKAEEFKDKYTELSIKHFDPLDEVAMILYNHLQFADAL